MSDGSLRLTAPDETLGKRNGAVQRSRAEQLLVRSGELGRLHLGIHGTAAQLHDLGLHECLFLAVATLAAEVVVHIGTGVVGPPRIDQEAAEQMDDPVAVAAGRLRDLAQHLDRLAVAAVTGEEFSEAEGRMGIPGPGGRPQQGNRFRNSVLRFQQVGKGGQGILLAAIGREGAQFRLAPVASQETGKLLGVVGVHDTSDMDVAAQQVDCLVDPSLAFEEPGVQRDGVWGIRAPGLKRVRRAGPNVGEQGSYLGVAAVARGELHQLLGEHEVCGTGAEEGDNLVGVALPSEQARQVTQGVPVARVGERAQQRDGRVIPLPVGEQTSDGADGRPPAGGRERLQQRQRYRLSVRTTRGSRLGKSAGAKPVTVGGCVVQEVVVAVLVKEGGDGGRYPAVVSAMTVVKVGCIHGRAP
ncbi:hypothetical protein [Streptomyces sp. NPDC057460]|uniref:hypothetical protein n=1 Tax=Streptomyces sp. NPDC057460 TaxID=3346141 RepID=UPI0036881A5D